MQATTSTQEPNLQKINGFIPNNNSKTSSIRTFTEEYCLSTGENYYTTNNNKIEETTLNEPSNIYLENKEFQTSPRFAVISQNRNKKAQELAKLHAVISNDNKKDNEESNEQNIGNDAEADAEVTKALLNSNEPILPQSTSPIKFQILNYVANTSQLHIRRTGSELQVIFTY